MKVYIQANSKKAINEALTDGKKVPAVEYNMFNPNGYMTDHILNDLPTGTIVSVFSKYVGGQPYAKAYGSWDKEKNKLK